MEMRFFGGLTVEETATALGSRGLLLFHVQEAEKISTISSDSSISRIFAR